MKYKGITTALIKGFNVTFKFIYNYILILNLGRSFTKFYSWRLGSSIVESVWREQSFNKLFEFMSNNNLPTSGFRIILKRRINTDQ